jgi:hypothetical protein
MGQVSDQLGDMATKQNATLLGIGVLLVAVVASGGAFNSIMPGGDDGNNQTDGEFQQISFNEYSVPVEIQDDELADSDTVYVVSADAEADEDYGNYEEAASSITDFGDAEVHSFDPNADGEISIAADRIGENEDFQAGQELRVFTDDTADYTSFETVSLPETIEKFKYQQDNPSETLAVDFLQNAQYEDDGTTTSSDGDDKTYEKVRTVTEGTSVMGDINVSNVGADVTEVSVTVTADGEQVYSESSDGSEDGETIASALSADLVEEEMSSNPVTAEDSVTVSVEVEADGAGNAVDVALNELDDGSVLSATV